MKVRVIEKLLLSGSWMRCVTSLFCVGFQYVNTNEHVPWEDMRYVFGQIMYGGHITDAWDRRCNNTYLDVYMRPDILHGLELAPGFRVPNTADMSYQDIAKYLENALPVESPPMFGLHPNAEIGYLTTFAEDLFQTILVLGGTGGGAGSSGSKAIRSTLEDLLERCPENFGMIDIKVCVVRVWLMNTVFGMFC